MRSKIPVILIMLLMIFMVFESCGGSKSSKGSTRLALIKKRGKIIVGCNAELPGFGYLNKQGKFEGFDVDFGMALAAAIFG